MRLGLSGVQTGDSDKKDWTNNPKSFLESGAVSHHEALGKWTREGGQGSLFDLCLLAGVGPRRCEVLKHIFTAW